MLNPVNDPSAKTCLFKTVPNSAAAEFPGYSTGKDPTGNAAEYVIVLIISFVPVDPPATVIVTVPAKFVPETVFTVTFVPELPLEVLYVAPGLASNEDAIGLSIVGFVANTVPPVPVGSVNDVRNEVEVNDPEAVPYKVPDVGRVTLVAPALVRIIAFAPEVVKLPPIVMVLAPLFTPVPPNCPITGPVREVEPLKVLP